jgi:hypothetical protein
MVEEEQWKNARTELALVETAEQERRPSWYQDRAK